MNIKDMLSLWNHISFMAEYLDCEHSDWMDDTSHSRKCRRAE